MIGWETYLLGKIILHVQGWGIVTLKLGLKYGRSNSVKENWKGESLSTYYDSPTASKDNPTKISMFEGENLFAKETMFEGRSISPLKRYEGKQCSPKENRIEIISLSFQKNCKGQAYGYHTRLSWQNTV